MKFTYCWVYGSSSPATPQVSLWDGGWVSGSHEAGGFHDKKLNGQMTLIAPHLKED